MTLPETPRFTLHVKGDAEKSTNDILYVTKKPREIMEVVPDISDQSEEDNGGVAGEEEGEEEAPEIKRASMKDFRQHFSKWMNFK